MSSCAEHTLYVVATPIGHRDDMSARAINVLRDVDVIYAEDTRHSLPLLRHHGIVTRVTALHEHNEVDRTAGVIAALRDGGSAALISDAGTPLISDPGYRIVKACLAAELPVSPVPGASALTAALSVSGLPTDRFQFVGFPPARSNARRTWLTPLSELTHTVVLYEATHRIEATLRDIVDVFGGDRELTLARELTKRFETILHSSAAEVLSALLDDVNQQRGEFVIMIAGVRRDDSQGGSATRGNVQLEQLLATILPHVSVKTAAQCAAELLSVGRKEAYQLALQLKNAAGSSDNPIE